MKLEDPIETWEFFQKTAGEAYVTKVDAFQTKPQSVMNNYLDTRSASSEKRARIDLLDLKDQREGEAHVFFKSTIIRAKMFYADPKPVKEMRLNQFLKVEPPSKKALHDFISRMEQFQKVVESQQIFETPIPESEEISTVANSLIENDFLEPIERGVTALLAYHGQSAKPVVEEIEEEEEAPDELSIFAKMRIPEEQKALLITDNLEAFGTPLLAKSFTREQVETLERLTGKMEKHALNISAEITKDIQLATHYPPEKTDDISTAELTNMVTELITQIQTGREKATAEGESGGDDSFDAL